jgi:hypothetical protein
MQFVTYDEHALYGSVVGVSHELHVAASDVQLESVLVSPPESPPLLLPPLLEELPPLELLLLVPLELLLMPLLLVVESGPPASGVGLLPLSSPHATTIVQARRLAPASAKILLWVFIS